MIKLSICLLRTEIRYFNYILIQHTLDKKIKYKIMIRSLIRSFVCFSMFVLSHLLLELSAYYPTFYQITITNYLLLIILLFLVSICNMSICMMYFSHTLFHTHSLLISRSVYLLFYASGKCSPSHK